MEGTAIRLGGMALQNGVLVHGPTSWACAVRDLPAALALRGADLAAYHGAEHVSIGTYENGGTPAPKEHPRCGSQLIAPMLVSSLAANVVAAKAPRATRGVARLIGTTAAIGASVEVFGWMTRNPGHPLARALARPSFELQRRLSTAQPTAARSRLRTRPVTPA